MTITSDELSRRRLTALTAVRCIALGIAAYAMYAFVNLATAIFTRSVREDTSQWWWLLHIAYGLAPFLIVNTRAESIGRWLVPDAEIDAIPSLDRRDPAKDVELSTKTADLVLVGIRVTGVAIAMWLVYVVLRLVADFFTYRAYWQTDADAAAGWITMEVIEFVMLLLACIVLLRRSRQVAQWLIRE